MSQYTLVVLGCYKDIFTQFAESWNRYERFTPCDKVLVRDGKEIPWMIGWSGIEMSQPYNMARNVNAGLRYAKKDVVFFSDDAQFTESNSMDRLNEIAYSDPSIGIVMPQIEGGTCRPEQHTEFNLPSDPYEVDYAPFIVYYLKREVIDQVGLLDERFTTYGWEDKDYCLRVRMMGYKIVLTNQVVVKHGFHRPEANTFARKNVQMDMKLSGEVFEKKWAHARKVLG